MTVQVSRTQELYTYTVTERVGKCKARGVVTWWEAVRDQTGDVHMAAYNRYEVTEWVCREFGPDSLTAIVPYKSPDLKGELECLQPGTR